MEDRVVELVSFIQERYLWQFAPRTWDRRSKYKWHFKSS